MLIDPYRFGVEAGGGGGGDDPFFADVSLLLHMDGANGGTSFPDSSVNALTMVLGGSPTTSTTDPAFGSASLRVNGSSYIGIIGAIGGPLDLGPGDFTIEGRFKFDGSSGTQCIFSFVDADFNPLFRLYRTDASNLTLQSNVVTGLGTWQGLSGISSITAGVWYSFAVVRSGSTGYLFVDGVKQADTVGSGGDWNGVPVWPAALAIGASSNVAGFTQFQTTGNVDEFRITKRARYTASYTPATEAFPDS